MANWQVMPAMSAMPASVKRTSLTQYGLRILRNTKLEVPWPEKAAMLVEFAARLRDSRYSQRFRQEVIRSILSGWDRMVKEQEVARRPINRSRSWQKEKRRQEKQRKKSSWYRTGGLPKPLGRALRQPRVHGLHHRREGPVPQTGLYLQGTVSGLQGQRARLCP